jgi:tRNA1(Val) A37 N6-methylase TrmN6
LNKIRAKEHQKKKIMPNPYFRFKQFTVYQDKCAVKVGIDGVLLGAWSDVKSSGKMLDVGTGTGLIALMIAQRSPAGSLWAVDNEESAFEQAKVNIGNSPFSGYTDARSQWHGFRPYHQSTYTGHLHHCFQRLCPGRI